VGDRLKKSKETFSAKKGLDLFVRWGRSGLFVYLVYRGIVDLIFKHRKRKMFSAGWHEPIAPEIVQSVYGKDFRTVHQETQDHPYALIEIEDETEGIIYEDLYPLV